MTDKKVILVIDPELSMEDINARIKQEVCYETLEELTDAKLMCEYKDCNSVKNEIKKLSDILEKYIDEETKHKIIQEYLLQLIPAGTKGVIRGNKFNKLVKQEIFKISHEDYPVIYKKKLGKNILNNRKFIKIINFRNKIAEKINLPKNWIFSDKEIIKNIKKEEVSISSKYLNNTDIKKLTNLITNFKKISNKFN